MGKNSTHSGAREIWAVVLVGLALLLLLSLISYDPFDVGNAVASDRPAVHNFIGPVGAWIGFVTFSTLGLGAYLLMVVLAGLGAMLLLGKELPWRGKVGAGILLLVSAGCLLHLMGLEAARKSLNLPSAGGFVGMFVGDFFRRLLGTIGTLIIFVVVYLVSLILLINLRPSYWVALTVGAARDYWHKFRRAWSKTDVRAELREQERELKIKEFQVDRELARKEREARRLANERAADEAEDRKRRPEPVIEDRTLLQKPVAEEAESSSIGKKIAAVTNRVLPRKDKPAVGPAEPATAAATGARPKPAKPAPKAEEIEADTGKTFDGPYQLPPFDLLEQPPAGQRSPTAVEDLKLNAEILRSTLEEFQIPVQVVGVTKGPVVTLYELLPAPGVKVEKISSLSNNIALAMKAVSVRILAPVPGKGTVGIEVPNTTTTTVYLRDILDTEEWARTKARIPIALGRDVAGNPIIADLGDMPHLLIAGATGTGKTVCVSAILASLLYRFSPAELRFVLIDPKVVEMQHYNVLSHLIVPVVTEAKKVPLALRWCITEMEKRFQLLAKAGVRNIAAFNARSQKRASREGEAPAESRQDAQGSSPSQGKQEELKIQPSQGEDIEVPDKLPYIVVVIDELADLMLVAPADVENAIARLAQLSRAVGIHLVLATQRPSVDIITGVIKANFPARIAFQVASKQDSRVILDANGADKLLGKGDMLYLPPGASKLIRAQGVLVVDDEIKRILEFIGARAKPRFVTEIHQKLQKSTVLPADLAEEEDEELVDQAIEVIRQTNRASVSVLQRRLRIGYTRAARIMDLLEERGMVGPNKGAEPRDILIDLDEGVPAER